MFVTREAVLATLKAVIEADPKTPAQCAEAAVGVAGGNDVLDATIGEVLGVVRVIDLLDLAAMLEGK